MRTTNGFLKTSMLLGFFAAMPSTGCIAPTVVGGNNDTSSSSDTTSSVMSSVGGGLATNAVAIRAGSTWGTGGGSSVVATVGVGGGFPMTATGSGGAPMTSGSMTSGVGGAPMTSGSGGAPGMSTAVSVGSGMSGVGGGPDMSTGVGGAPSFDPDTLYLEIDSNPITCVDWNSLDDTMGCADGTHVRVELPPAAQAVGVYQLNDGSGVNVYSSISMPDCSGGGGNIFDEVNVLAVTPTSLTVQISGIPSTDGYDPNGLYIIPRCEAGPSAPPTKGIAIHPSDIPPTMSTSVVTAGGGPSSDTDLILILHDTDANDPAAVCANPYGAEADCNAGGWQISVTLPLAYQVPGTYPLMDPNLNASYGEWEPMCSGGGGGSFWGGSIEVKSAGPMGVIARFIGNLDSHQEITQADVYYYPCSQD